MDIPSLDFDLGEDVELLRHTVREFAANEIAPLAEAVDRDSQFPNELWPRLGELGVLGLTVEEQFGGVDLGYLAHVVAVEEISRASPSIGLSYGAHSNLCVNQLAKNATQAQKEKFLPPLVRGEHIGALAMSETSSGSDVV